MSLCTNFIYLYAPAPCLYAPTSYISMHQLHAIAAVRLNTDRREKATKQFYFFDTDFGPQTVLGVLAFNSAIRPTACAAFEGRNVYKCVFVHPNRSS
jgi:hypothetical protein